MWSPSCRRITIGISPRYLPWEPLCRFRRDSHGQVTREVAPARISLPREDHPDEPLCLQVARIRDLRRRVPVQPDPEEAPYPSRWDSDLPREERTWWREGWQATAAPAKETTAKLIPIVTTEETQPIDAIELAQTYIRSFPAQENISKDYLLPLGLDANHGFAKSAVENSEMAKRRAHLEQRLVRLKQWALSAGKHEARASRRREKLRKTFANRSKELYQDLWAYQRTDGASKGWPITCCGGRSKSAKLLRMPSWNSFAAKNGAPMSNVTPSSTNKNATAKNSEKSCAH